MQICLYFVECHNGEGNITRRIGGGCAGHTERKTAKRNSHKEYMTLQSGCTLDNRI